MKLKIPYFQWRDGRPRWEPGPALRARGHHGQDLKDAAGRFLALGAAVEAAKTLNAAAAEAKANRAVQPAVARTWGHLFDTFAGRDKWQALAPRTRRSYAQHLRLMRPWIGDVLTAQLRASDIETFYFALVRERGLAQANAVIRTLKVVAYWGRDRLGWTLADPKSWLDAMPVPAGRLVLWEADEIAAFVAWADFIRLDSQGDALLLGLFTGQRQGDILSLAPLDDAAPHVELKTRKTGRRVFVPRTAMLSARLAKMRARKAARWPNVAFATELVDARGRTYTGDRSAFGEEFRLVRALAAGAGATIVQIAAAAFGYTALRRPGPVYDLPVQPSILGKRYADLRDTAITWLLAAGCSVAEIANITGHSLKTVQAVIDKHYYVRNAAMAIAAGAKLDTWLTKTGMKL